MGNLGSLLSCSGIPSRVSLGGLVSSWDVQGGACLVAMCGLGTLVRHGSLVVVGVNSVVVVGLILSSCGCKLLSCCGVRFVSISSSGARLYV